MKQFIRYLIKTLSICFIVSLYSSCLWIKPEWNRYYQSHSYDKYSGLSEWDKNIENSIFDKYSVNNTTFILLANPNFFSSNWRERNTVTGRFTLHIFKKPKDFVTYRLLKATINTLSYSNEIFDFYIDEVVFDPSDPSTAGVHFVTINSKGNIITIRAGIDSCDVISINIITAQG